MASTGLTGGHVMDLDEDGLELLAALDEAGELPLRLRLAPWCRPDDDGDRIDELLSMQKLAGRLWQIDAVKLFMDGTVDGGTAWLDEPDCHGESRYSYWQDPRDYAKAVRRFAHAGVQTATHAIGDAAVQYVLDTLEGIGSSAASARHRIEHIETLPSDQVRRFAQLGVIASMQPTHATDYTRADHSDNWSTRLGDERANRAWRCRDLIDSGAVVTLGSDWPIAPYDPRGVLAAAQLRRPATHPGQAPVLPGQALSAMQALAGYTVAPAYAAREEHLAGRIAPGFRADLTVFGADPRAVPANELPEVDIALTVVDGLVRHRGDGQ
jgi:predicted amidohydrolase YtcJ